MNQKIVVFDPSNRYWEGSLVGDEVSRQVQGRGGVTLPVVPELFKRAGVAGYFKRSWGAGWPLDYPAPKMCCPLSLWVDKNYGHIHWAARLLPAESLLLPPEEGQVWGNAKHKIQGQLRFMVDGGHPNSFQSSVSVDPKCPAVDGATLGLRPDAGGGWNVGGRVTMQAGNDGYFSFALYGAMPGLRVAWAALSLTGP